MTVRHLFPDVAPVLNLDFANSKRLDPRITFTRASTGTYVDEAGIIRTAAANQARFDHDGSGNSLGLLVEESRTNLYANSNSATGTAATVTLGGGPSPDGGTSAMLLTANTTGGYVQANTSFIVGTIADHTISFWYKNGTGTATAIRIEGILNGGGRGYFIFNDLNDGSNVTPHTTHTSTYGIQDFPGGWKRFYMGYNSSSGTNAAGSFVLRIAVFGIANTETCYLFGLQAEAGSFPTSYIPTSGSTATRSADVASMTGTNFSSWYNQGQGTWLANIRPFGGAAFLEVFDNGPIIQTYAGGSYGLRVGAEAIFLNLATPISVAMGYTQGVSISASSRGSSPLTVATSLGSMSELHIGRANNAFTSFWVNETGFAHFPRLAYYDRRLTDAQLQALTL